MLLFAVVLNKPLKRYPVLFYILALLISAAGVYLTLTPNPNPVLRAFAFALQKGHLGFAAFTLVMYIGVFSSSNPLRRILMPVRGELSIIASLLILGHLTPYLSNYLSLAAGLFSLQLNIQFSLIIAFVMLILLIPLTVTSFNVVKKRMGASRWKTIQRFAYLFFGLVFFHLLGYLSVPALNGSINALISMIVYTVIFAVYMVARIRKANLDKRQDQETL
jgi:DMSO/TMAO reductase YedYZ heme-binding membrane subunit